jgi:hypothetical protein
MRPKIEPVKQLAIMIRTHFDGIVAWTRSCQINGFIEVTTARRSTHRPRNHAQQ